MTYVLTGSRARLNERASGLQEAERDTSEGHREVKKDFCRYHTHSASSSARRQVDREGRTSAPCGPMQSVFPHGLSGAILQGLRCVQEFSGAHRRLSG